MNLWVLYKLFGFNDNINIRSSLGHPVTLLLPCVLQILMLKNSMTGLFMHHNDWQMV